MPRSRWWIPLLIGAYFLAFTWRGLLSGFFPDDMINMYGAWERSPSTLFKDHLMFWHNNYRPLGALIYRPLYEWFGMNPLPFRIAAFLLLFLNLCIAYRAAKAFSNETAVALLATLIFAYQPYLSDMYVSTATIYDLECFACYWGAVWIYARGASSWRRIAFITVLYWLALNAKEMAVTLPGILFAYDLAFKRRPNWRALVPLGAMAAIFAIGKVVLMRQDAIVAPFIPHLTGERLHSALKHYSSLLLYMPVEKPWAGYLVVAFCALVIWRTTKPYVRFAAVAFLLIPIPVLFIDERSLYVYYLPLFAWGLIWAGLVGNRRPLAVAVIALVVFLNIRHVKNASEWINVDAFKVPRMISEFDKLRPARRILITNDSIPPDDWILLLAARLGRHDLDLQVWRVAQLGQPQETDWDVKADFKDWQLRNILWLKR